MHDVQLLAGSFCIGVRGSEVNRDAVLELQPCDARLPRWQRFALDGDAIVIGTQCKGIPGGSCSGPAIRDMVIEPLGDATAEGTPLSVGTRDLSDAEYFSFKAIDGSSAPVHSGFVRANNEAQLRWALSPGWGTVVEIGGEAPDSVLNPNATTMSVGQAGALFKTMVIHGGVTLRGYRNRTIVGPEIHFAGLPDKLNEQNLFTISEDYVRITGLRITPAPAAPAKKRSAMSSASRSPKESTTFIDRNDMSAWTDSCVFVNPILDDTTAETWVCPDQAWRDAHPLPRSTATRVVKNFSTTTICTGGGLRRLRREGPIHSSRGTWRTPTGTRLPGGAPSQRIQRIRQLRAQRVA